MHMQAPDILDRVGQLRHMRQPGKATASSTMKGATPTEYQVQCSVVAYFKLVGLECYHVPNQEARGKTPAERAKRGAQSRAMGTRSGVADLVILGAGGLSLHLEMKKPGGRLSASQKMFASDLAKIGAPCVWADNLDDAKALVVAWISSILAIAHPPGAETPTQPEWAAWARRQLARMI